MLRRAASERPGNSGVGFVLDGAALGMQIADRRVRHHHLVAQRFQRLLAAPASEVMPERGQPSRSHSASRPDGAAALSASAAGGAQALIRIGEARALLGLDVGLVLRDLARFLLARQIRGERRKLLMAGLPQRAQLKEHQRAEAGLRIAEQIAERIQLFLHADGRAFLLLEAVAQQMKFVLEVGVGLLQTRTILEQLHEPLFIGAHCAALRTAF